MAPQLRGLLHSAIKKNLIVASGLSVASLIALKVLHNDPRKARYAEFYKSYDINKDFERMRKAGLFQSAQP